MTSVLLLLRATFLLPPRLAVLATRTICFLSDEANVKSFILKTRTASHMRINKKMFAPLPACLPSIQSHKSHTYTYAHVMPFHPRYVPSYTSPRCVYYLLIFHRKKYIKRWGCVWWDTLTYELFVSLATNYTQLKIRLTLWQSDRTCVGFRRYVHFFSANCTRISISFNYLPTWAGWSGIIIISWLLFRFSPFLFELSNPNRDTEWWRKSSRCRNHGYRVS